MPLAHILMPQIARKAIEIEQALNPRAARYLPPDVDTARRGLQKKLSESKTDPGVRVKTSPRSPDSGVRADVAPANTAYPQTAGYLQAPGYLQSGDVGAPAPGSQSPITTGKLPPGYNWLGDDKVETIRRETEAQAKQYDPRGVMGRPKLPELYDPGTVGGQLAQMRGNLQRISPKAAAGFDSAVMPDKRQMLIPNAPAPTTRAYLGQTLTLPDGRTIQIEPGDVVGENGVPVAPQAPAPKFDKKGRQIITLPKDMQRINEYGEPIDKKGKRIKGYLAQDPNLRFPKSDPMDPFETGGAELRKRLPGAGQLFEQRYRPHLEAMQSNRDEQGMPTGKLPKGYFEALGRERGKPYSKAEQEDVLNGIKALRQMEKGVSI